MKILKLKNIFRMTSLTIYKVVRLDDDMIFVQHGQYIKDDMQQKKSMKLIS